MHPILVTAKDLHPEAQAILSPHFHLHFSDMRISEAELIAKLNATQAEAILLRGSAPVTRAVMASAPKLKLIAKNGVGVDSVDLIAAKELGITVKVATAANADAVAEQAIAMMLSLIRELPFHTQKVKSGEWVASNYQGRDFKASKVGIIGYGAIGQRTAQLARALGAKVVVHRLGNVKTADDFDTTDLITLLATCDIVSLHCPLTTETRHLIGVQELAHMQAKSILVNTARGGLVDEIALVSALNAGKLFAAGLDTFAQEPLAKDSPILTCNRVVLTPHIAGVTMQSARQVSLQTAHNLIDFFQTIA